MPDLFPTIDVTAEKRATAAICVAFMSGYREFDAEDNLIDPGLEFDANGWVTNCNWTDDAAIWQHYRRWLVRELQNERQAALQAVINAEDFE